LIFNNPKEKSTKHGLQKYKKIYDMA